MVIRRSWLHFSIPVELSCHAAACHRLELLCRDEDCEGVLRSMARMEQRFNHKFRYPYVFLNNGPFSSEFKSRSVQHIHVQSRSSCMLWDMHAALLQAKSTMPCHTEVC